MEMRSAKQLDEACNRYNDTYGDEVLYAQWISSPHADPEAPRDAAAGRSDLSNFLAGLHASRQAH